MSNCNRTLKVYAHTFSCNFTDADRDWKTRIKKMILRQCRFIVDSLYVSILGVLNSS